jgi:hypothetical protein
VRIVFGRTEYAEPLVELGSTEGDPLAAFPGDWVELIAFPDDVRRWIVREGKEVEDEREYVRARN